MDFVEAHCVLCNLSLSSEGVGLIGNGGIVCRKCYHEKRDSAREISGRNNGPDLTDLNNHDQTKELVHQGESKSNATIHSHYY